MYNFHYETIQQRYTDRVKLLFTDLDSLCYFIETDHLENNILAEIHNMMHLNFHRVTNNIMKKKNRYIER